jgi:prepilin-type N-terminal cleavage/methylation domain-containing protein
MYVLGTNQAEYTHLQLLRIFASHSLSFPTFSFFMTTTRSTRGLRKGFTLIELLLVIGIIAILASIVIVAINPTRQLGQARNAQRHSDVNTLINAVYQYAIDRNGLPNSAAITSTNAHICRTGSSAGGTGNGNCVSLYMLTGSYLVSIPVDPSLTSTGTGWTGYMIRKDASERVTVTAANPELGESISVTR